MKFSVSSTTLCNRLQALSRVLSSKNSIQILDCILFELKGQQLRLTASDSETTLTSTLEVNESQGEGRFAVKAVTVINGLKEISEQPVTIEVNDATYEIVIDYQNGRGNFVGQSADEYPLPQPISNETQELTLDTGILLNGISRALFATAEDELRPVMNGIYIDFNAEGLTFVASDGHKLVRDRCTSLRADRPAAFILPKKPVKTLKDILVREDGEAVIRFDEKNAEITMPSFRLSCRLIEGRYPNYGSVIPADNPYHITLERAALIGALRRVLVFASTSTSLIRLRFENNNLTISSQDLDYSTSAEEHILCDYNAAPLSIGFKGTFLIDILNSMSAQDIVLQLADPSRAGVIVPAVQEKDEDLLMLLMPMMLND
jgi:DNA polymerase-3 subunit beta